ncbi:sensor histidine kinase [Flagellimonas allohymeniacidonis]|uniref:Signal transduction histidine kinase internal region domain-containing protein n=1 Tax=Flagellimonas allohymeniacidonis TaxID=2517819 RepID=A0A4Q8QF52_9FLAO|nr:histidine kinase [Allomuricauda hymeniacidonis]TAI48474.1 hypothetical protein EW142_01325 [Allomuricauda hymeniacidonis]
MNNRIFVVLIAILLHVGGISQESLFTQQYIDTFQMRPITRLKLKKFKEVLEKDKELKGWSKYYSLSAYRYFSSDYNKDSALYFANKAISYFEEFGDMNNYQQEALTKPYFILGWYARLEENHRKAVEYNLKGVELAKTMQRLYARPSKYLPYFYRDIMYSYVDLGYISSAKKYAHYLITNDWYMKREGIYIYNQLGILHSYENQLDSAKYYFKKGLTTLEKEKEEPDFIEIQETLWINTGNVFRKSGNLDSTLYYYKMANSDKPYIESKRLPNRSLISLLNKKASLAYLDIHKGDVNNALKELNAIRDSIFTNGLDVVSREKLDLRILLSETFIDGYKKGGNYRMAFREAERKNVLIEQLNDLVLKENIEELQARFDLKEKENEINELGILNAVQKAKIRQRNTVLYIILALIIIFLLLVYGWVQQGKLKSKYQIISLQQRLLRSQLNPHFIFNSLNSVHGLITKEPSNAQSYLLKFSSLLRQTLQNSREEFIPIRDEIDALRNYLDLQSSFFKKFDYQIEIDNSNELKEKLIPPMFIQPFVENSIEHGFVDNQNNIIKISIGIDKGKKVLNCTILDNGQGYSKAISSSKEKRDSPQSSNILKDRIMLYAKYLKTDAFYRIKGRDQNIGNGTTVDISIPYIVEY